MFKQGFHGAALTGPAAESKSSVRWWPERVPRETLFHVEHGEGQTRVAPFSICSKDQAWPWLIAGAGRKRKSTHQRIIQIVSI